MKAGTTFIFLIALLSLLGCSGDSSEGPALQEKSVLSYIETKLMDIRL